MWHRVQGWDVLESVETLPAEVSVLTDVMIHYKGWRKGVEDLQPWFDSPTQKLEKVVTFDHHAGVVRESWKVVPVDSQIAAGAARELRRLRKLPVSEQIDVILRARGFK